MVRVAGETRAVPPPWAFGVVWTALLLVPYLAWVTFATVLNFQFWQLN